MHTARQIDHEQFWRGPRTDIRQRLVNLREIDIYENAGN